VPGTLRIIDGREQECSPSVALSLYPEEPRAPEAFAKHGIKYEPCSVRKSDLYRDVLPLLNSGRVRLLDNARMRSQFVNLERNTSRGGRDSIDHPKSSHDDVANAVAGAALAANARKPRAWIGFGGPGYVVPGQDYPRIVWREMGEEPEHSRIRVEHISEQEDLRRRGLL
jgi:hypothetical protein